MDISRRTVVAAYPEDRSWLGSAHGTEATKTITLLKSLFTSGTHYADGYVHSGTVLGKVTASGLYGPYDDAASDGRQVAAGHLYGAIDFASPQANTAATRHGAALLEHGMVLEALLPTNHGLDTAAKTDLAGRITYR